MTMRTPCLLSVSCQISPPRGGIPGGTIDVHTGHHSCTHVWTKEIGDRMRFEAGVGCVLSRQLAWRPGQWLLRRHYRQLHIPFSPSFSNGCLRGLGLPLCRPTCSWFSAHLYVVVLQVSILWCDHIPPKTLCMITSSQDILSLQTSTLGVTWCDVGQAKCPVGIEKRFLSSDDSRLPPICGLHDHLLAEPLTCSLMQMFWGVGGFVLFGGRVKQNAHVVFALDVYRAFNLHYMYKKYLGINRLQRPRKLHKMITQPKYLGLICVIFGAGRCNVLCVHNVELVCGSRACKEKARRASQFVAELRPYQSCIPPTWAHPVQRNHTDEPKSHH